MTPIDVNQFEMIIDRNIAVGNVGEAARAVGSVLKQAVNSYKTNMRNYFLWSRHKYSTLFASSQERELFLSEERRKIKRDVKQLAMFAIIGRKVRNHYLNPREGK